MSSLRSVVFLVSVILALFACSYKVNKSFDDGELGVRPSAEFIARVSYGDVAKIFQSRCISCHGSSGRVNLESYGNVKAALEGIYRSTIVEKRMPKSPVPSLTNEERLTLWAWIEAGGPEFPVNGSPGSSPPSPPVLEPNFESIRVGIFLKKCIFCHGPGGKAARVPLLTREDLLNSPLDLVIPGNPDESGLILSVIPEARKPMPPPNSGFTAVSAEELAVLKEWIQKGAVD